MIMRATNGLEKRTSNEVVVAHKPIFVFGIFVVGPPFIRRTKRDYLACLHIHYGVDFVSLPDTYESSLCNVGQYPSAFVHSLIMPFTYIGSCEGVTQCTEHSVGIRNGQSYFSLSSCCSSFSSLAWVGEVIKRF